jgi:hypothetical protein
LRKILIVGALFLAVFVAVFRQRIFVRDPLGKVEKNGVAQDARIYINYSNDVLLEDPSRHQFVLVQGWSAVPGVPQRLVCLTGLVCWTDADRATVFPVKGVGGRTLAVMSAKVVTFVDEAGAGVRIELR